MVVNGGSGVMLLVAQLRIRIELEAVPDPDRATLAKDPLLVRQLAESGLDFLCGEARLSRQDLEIARKETRGGVLGAQPSRQQNMASARRQALEIRVIEQRRVEATVRAP
jgi:hypothetical protein